MRLKVSSVLMLASYMKVLGKVTEQCSSLYSPVIVGAGMISLSKISPDVLPSTAVLEWILHSQEPLFNLALISTSPRRIIVDMRETEMPLIKWHLEVLIAAEPSQRAAKIAGLMRVVPEIGMAEDFLTELVEVLCVPQNWAIYEYIGELDRETRRRTGRGGNSFNSDFLRMASSFGFVDEDIPIIHMLSASGSLPLIHIDDNKRNELRVLIISQWLRQHKLSWEAAVDSLVGEYNKIKERLDQIVPPGSGMSREMDMQSFIEFLELCCNRAGALANWDHLFDFNESPFYQSDAYPDDPKLAAEATVVALGSGFYEMATYYGERARGLTPALYFRLHEYSQLAFCYLMSGMLKQASGAFQLIGEAFFEENFAVYYGSYLAAVGDADIATIWFEVATIQEDFPIVFNCWAIPQVAPKVVQEYLQQARIAADELANNKRSKKDIPYKENFPYMILTSRTLALLWQIDFACQDRVPRDDTRVGNLVYRLFNLSSETFIESNISYDSLAVDLWPYHFWHKLVRPMMGVLPIELADFPEENMLAEFEALENRNSNEAEFSDSELEFSSEDFSETIKYTAVTFSEETNVFPVHPTPAVSSDIKSAFERENLVRQGWQNGDDQAREGSLKAISAVPHVDHGHYLYQQGQYHKALERLQHSFGCLDAPTAFLIYPFSERSVYEAGLQMVMESLPAESLDGEVIAKFPAVALAHYLEVRCYECLANNEKRREALAKFDDWIVASNQEIPDEASEGACQVVTLLRTFLDILSASENSPVPLSFSNPGAYELNPASGVASMTSVSEDDKGLEQQAGLPSIPH